MADTIKCSVCGKEMEVPEGKLGEWMVKNPDKAKCSACFGQKAPAASKTSTAKSSTSKTSSYSKSTKSEVTAKLFRQAYDELMAEFADVADDIKDYIGGWTSTIVINRSR